MKRVLSVVLLALVTASAAQAGGGTAALYGGYRYDGRPVCAPTATLNLTATTVYPDKNSHTALWSGVYAAGSEEWVQAGVTSDDGSAYTYLEWSVGGRYKLLRLGSGASAKVGLMQHGNAWTLTVGARSVTVKLGAHTRCFVGGESEDWGKRNVLRGTVSIGQSAFKVAL